jgi:hypothetical protein
MPLRSQLRSLASPDPPCLCQRRQFGAGTFARPARLPGVSSRRHLPWIALAEIGYERAVLVFGEETKYGDNRDRATWAAGTDFSCPPLLFPDKTREVSKRGLGSVPHEALDWYGRDCRHEIPRAWYSDKPDAGRTAFLRCQRSSSKARY